MNHSVSEIAEARPASTVVLLRDCKHGLETLLLKRNKALLFAGGLWVFPGGSIDAEEMDEAGGDIEQASRRAAAREAMEESGLQPALEEMVLLSHWTTPIAEPKRFSTWIYAAPLAVDDEVVIDGGEIHDSRWIVVRDAVAEHEAGQLNMLPPTYLTLRNLCRYDSVAQMVTVERESDVPEVFPVFASDGEQMVVMFRGDAGYDSADGDTPGARHRAMLLDRRWEYLYRDVDEAYPPLVEP
ncbi:MAG: NUDIX domain-containing protein [Pseudomonadota bacterium]